MTCKCCCHNPGFHLDDEALFSFILIPIQVQLFINIKMDSWTAITFQHEGHLNYWKKNVFDVKQIVFITCTQIAFRSNVFFNGKWQLFHLIHV